MADNFKPRPESDDPLGALTIVATGPDLRTGLCVGLYNLFDPQREAEEPDNVEARHAVALALCARCPVAEACRDQYESGPPSQQPTGVIAGRVVGDRPSTNRPNGNAYLSVSNYWASVARAEEKK